MLRYLDIAPHTPKNVVDGEFERLPSTVFPPIRATPT